MKTKTIELYTYSELNRNAQKKAIDNWRNSGFDSYAVQVFLDNRVSELLEENGITPIMDLKGYNTKYVKVYWSLSNCQGDGVMFEGVVKWRDLELKIKQSGHYYHSYSKDVEEVGGQTFKSENEAKEFESIYQKICKTLEKEGYKEIEALESEDNFIELCNANEWTFRADGTMEN